MLEIPQATLRRLTTRSIHATETKLRSSGSWVDESCNDDEVSLNLQESVISELRSLGYSHLRLAGGLHSDECLEALEGLLTPVAAQVRVFAARPLWRSIGANPHRPQNRSEGVGESPLHIDFVNAERPPDYVVLYCVRSDPLGGGQSTVSSFASALIQLSETECAHLGAKVFRDGEVRDLENVGIDVNPFAVYDPDATWAVRYTGHLLGKSYPSDVGDALLAFAKALDKVKMVIPLESNDVLILDQRKVAHGKLPLGAPQERLEPAVRRLLLQGFFRRHNTYENERD